MTAENRTRTPARLNWRFLLGEFVVIVVGVLLALWVDQLREARVNAGLEVEYLRSLVVDIDADLAQFDETEAWMRRSEAAAAQSRPSAAPSATCTKTFRPPRLPGRQQSGARRSSALSAAQSYRLPACQG